MANIVSKPTFKWERSGQGIIQGRMQVSGLIWLYLCRGIVQGKIWEAEANHTFWIIKKIWDNARQLELPPYTEIYLVINVENLNQHYHFGLQQVVVVQRFENQNQRKVFAVYCCLPFTGIRKPKFFCFTQQERVQIEEKKSSFETTFGVFLIDWQIIKKKKIYKSLLSFLNFHFNFLLWTCIIILSD